MKKLILTAVALGQALAAHATLYWTSAPGSANSGSGYYIAAHGAGPESNEMWLYKNGGFVGYSNGWYSVDLGYSATDYGAQTVHYHADACYMWYNGGEYIELWEGIDHWITINQPNSDPTITWTQAPSSAPLGSWFNIEARGNDADGNLSNVFVWREWQPHAFADGGNGYEKHSGNPGNANAVGTITFMAQAKDSADHYSPVIYHSVTVYVPNVAPTATWVINPASAWVNQWFTIQSRGNDGNGNLAWIRVWKDGAPFAFNGGGNGWEGYSDNNGASKSATGSFHFQTQAGDADGAQSALHSHYVTINNRTPHSPTLSASGTGVTWNATGQHYEMWLEELGNPAKPGTITLTGNVKDDDGNLTLHRIWKGPGGSFDWADPITSLTPSNGADSTAVHTNFKPAYTGRWDFHTNAQDNAGAWSGGASKTVWVYGPTNNAEVISIKVNGVTYAPNTASIPVTLNNNASIPIEVVMRNGGTGASKPWTTDATPHGLGTVGDDNRWGSTRKALPSSPINPFPTPGQSATFTFNLTAPGQPMANQTVRWQMVEDGVQWFGAQTPPLVVTVIDTIAPSVPTGLAASAFTPATFVLSWTAPSDNSGSVSLYEVFRGGVSLGTSAATSFTVTGHNPNANSSLTVRARDAAGNWSAQSAALVVTDPNGDNDGDGMPNGWEQTNGLNYASSSDALTDLDGDGLANIAEYNLGGVFAANSYNQGTSNLGNAIPAGWPNADANPAVAVGATTGALSVDKSGAATYSVPLWTTPGSSGLQPQVSLNYSSASGPGLAGFGWSLGGVSAITRGPKTKLIDGANKGVTLTADDQFYLDGQRLLLVSGAHGQSGAEYRTELDSLSKVVVQGVSGAGPSWFKVWTKAGLILEFGNTADSAFNPGGGATVHSWHANRIGDTKGNYMLFEYTEDTAAGSHRLARINYTGNGSVAPYASLRFEYEDRPDWVRGYTAGLPLASLHRLKAVKSYYGENLARTYTLAYVQRPLTERSMLASLTEAGKPTAEHPNGKAYQPLLFEYNDNDTGWNDGAAFLPDYYLADNTNSNRPAGSGFIDFNGDGRTDFVAYRSGVINIARRNTGSGWADEPTYQLPHPLAFSGSSVDSGGRFADVNGDGLVDYLWWRRNSSGQTLEQGAVLNTGSGWASAPQWTPPAPIAQDNLPLHSGKFLDVNADGRMDFVGHIRTGQPSNHNIFVYLNTGSGWQYDAALSTISHDVAGWKGRFLDLNGDGLVDIAVHYNGAGNYLQKSWLNTGSGWSDTPAYYLPQLIADNTQNSIGADFIDANGDGLPDLLWYREVGAGHQRGVALNTGAGWIQSTDIFNAYAPPQPLSRDNYFNAGGAHVDVNLDGLPDVLFARHFNGQSAQRYVYFGTARHWAYAGAGSAFELPHNLLQDGVPQLGADFVDLNGDGAVDVVWKRKEPNGADFADARLNKAKPAADRLKKVTNAFGVAAELTYGSLLNPAVYAKAPNNDDLPAADRPLVANLTGPLQVVTSVRNENGAGGFHDLAYSYGSLRSHLDRGSLGFGYLRVHDTATDVRTQTWFRQDYPFIGSPDYVKVTRASDTANLLSESDTTWAVRLQNAGAPYQPRLVYAATVEEKTYDLDSGSLTLTTTTATAEPDAWGNIGSITVATSDGHTKATTNTYEAADTVNWILGRLQTATVVSSAPGVPSLTRASAFTYEPGSGLLKTETVEPGHATQGLTTTYGYDPFGNKTSVTVTGKALTVDTDGNYSAGADTSRVTTTQYDARGRFPDWTRNALNHQETYTAYDQELGVLLSLTGANGLPTSWAYDGFGRKTQETRADGTVTHTRYKWAAAGSPAGSLYHIEAESTGAAPALAFHDKYGRPIRGLSISGDGRIVHQGPTYDALGRVSSRTNPYYNDGSPVYATTTTYDILGRPKTVVTPDDQNGAQTTSYNYNGFTATVTDPKGRVAETVKNSQGWTLSNLRNKNAGPGAADYSAVTYAYDALGNLVQTVAAGVSTTLAYDLRGRKETMTDPDMGLWRYRYNSFGELIWQKDAKGWITRLAYDALGRLVSRVERNDANTADETTTWTYDTSPTKGVGKLHTVSAPGGYAEEHLYDTLGRPVSVTRTIDGATYALDTAYDSVGRPKKTEYPTVNGGRFATRSVYNAFGYLKEIRQYLTSDDALANSQLTGKVLWEADVFNAAGRIEGEILGNGLANDRVYSAATGRLLSAGIDAGRVTGPPYALQQMVYTYDAMGNVLTRADQAVARGEAFSYDGLDRLLSHSVVTGAGGTVTVAYDQKGNITNKSDVGAYAYDPVKPHAVTSAGANTYTYDANGNMLEGAGRTVTWTSFNQARSIVKGAFTSTFSFDAAHQRVKHVSHHETTIYVGGVFEQVTPAGASPVVEFKHYILAPTGRVAVFTDRSNLQRDVKYFHTDGLGSITAVTDEKGAIVKRFAFDAWGKRINPVTGMAITGADAAGLRRGYTDHEQLDDLGLVHMNGRVYDPVLGRFLSADPFIGDPSDSQDYNRYSYLGSNPLGGTDPSGYFSLKDGLKIVAAVVVGVITAGAALYGYAALMGGSFVGGFAGALSSVGLAAGWGGGWAIAAGAGFGFGSSFASSLLNGGSIGDAFKAGVIGGVVGGISAGIAGKIGDFAEGHEWFQGAGQNLAHGIAQGGLTEAQGGEFRHGFYAGFASSAAAGPIQATMPNSMGGRVAAAAVVGGTASALGGGKFANGAVSGAFTYMFNHEAHSWWDDTKETLSVAWQGAKQGYYAWADGLNPFGDFYADMGLYNASDPALQWSQRFGVVSQVAGGGLVGGAGLYGGARSVFWSGGRTAARAAETLGRPIQKTLWGRVMNAAQGGLRNVFGKPAADKAMAPFWDAASSVYAMNVRGTAQAYILRPGPVWTNVERPLLDMLGKSYRVVP